MLQLEIQLDLWERFYVLLPMVQSRCLFMHVLKEVFIHYDTL